MIADVDAAAKHVHGCSYIWLADNNGLKLKDAFVRAAQRGVAGPPARRCTRARACSSVRRTGESFAPAAVRCAWRYPSAIRLWTVIRGRVDLRNHRKLLIVDNRIAWCGSQNVADPEFRIKPRYAPWVDIMSRWEGPVALHSQYLFVSDWIAEGGDDISALLIGAAGAACRRDRRASIGTGPTVSFDAMPSCFSELIHSAREELVVTTPYFVPDEQLLFALTSAARRGVHTIMMFPKRNDNWIVAASSRSYYQDLIDAGVRDIRVPLRPAPRQDHGRRSVHRR